MKRPRTGPAETHFSIARDFTLSRRKAALSRRVVGNKRSHNRTFVQTVTLETKKEKKKKTNSVLYSGRRRSRRKSPRSRILERIGTIKIVTHRGPKSMKFVIKHPSKDIHRAIGSRTLHKFCQVCHQVPEQRLARRDPMRTQNRAVIPR